MSNALLSDLAVAADPVVLARRLGVDPDPWQAGVLRSTDPRVLLCCSRQAGKSTVASIAVLHCALYNPGSLSLIFAPTQRQAQELFRSVTRWYRALGRPVASDQDNTMSLSLENGSRIVALPGDERTVRGFAAAALIVVDEASRVSDEFYRSIRPMLAVSRGRFIALSTPFGARGWFHAAATGEPGWTVVNVTADQVPRISTGFLADELATMGAWAFKQEYGCEFVAAGGAYFDQSDIDALSSPEVMPLFGGAR